MTTCPHCGNPLPVPPERFCPHCGGLLDAVPVQPALPAGAARPAGTPWERRGEGGLLAALVETTQQVLTRPSEFFASMDVAGGIGQPVLYALIVGVVGVLASAVYQTVLKTVAGPALAGLGGASPAERLLPFVSGWVGFVMQVAAAPFAVLFSVFVGAGIVHLLLMMFGGAQRGFEATVRVRCYCEAAAVLNIIPFCGVFLQMVALAVLLVIGLSTAHGTSRGVAAAAVLVPIVLVCCCCGALVFLFAGAIMAALGQVHP